MIMIMIVDIPEQCYCGKEFRGLVTLAVDLLTSK